MNYTILLVLEKKFHEYSFLNYDTLNVPYNYSCLTKDLTCLSEKSKEEQKNYLAKISKNGKQQYYVKKEKNHYFSFRRDAINISAKKAYQNVQRLFEQARKLQIFTNIPILTIFLNKNEYYDKLFQLATDLNILVCRVETDKNWGWGYNKKLVEKLFNSGLSEQDEGKIIQAEWTSQALFLYLQVLYWLAPFKDREDVGVCAL